MIKFLVCGVKLYCHIEKEREVCQVTVIQVVMYAIVCVCSLNPLFVKRNE